MVLHDPPLASVLLLNNCSRAFRCGSHVWTLTANQYLYPACQPRRQMFLEWWAGRWAVASSPDHSRTHPDTRAELELSHVYSMPACVTWKSRSSNDCCLSLFTPGKEDKIMCIVVLYPKWYYCFLCLKRLIFAFQRLRKSILHEKIVIKLLIGHYALLCVCTEQLRPCSLIQWVQSNWANANLSQCLTSDKKSIEWLNADKCQH